MNEIKFWQDFLARLNIKLANELINNEDFTRTKQRIENAETELNILLNGSS